MSESKGKPLAGVIAGLALAWMAGTSAARPADDGLPVVFVPGTGGSSLVIAEPGGKRTNLWIAPHLLGEGMASKLALAPDGQGEPTPIDADTILRTLKLRISVDVRVESLDERDPPFVSERVMSTRPLPFPVYGAFLDWAQAEWLGDRARLFEVPYDWRKGACEENARAVDAAVDRALRETGKSRVVLVAHSLGGLVCRDYLCRGDNARKVRALIAVGTPWLGSPKAARALRWGYNFGLGGRLDPPVQVRGVYIYHEDKGGKRRPVPYLSLVSLLDPAKTREVARTLPCVFQQLPTAEYMALYGSTQPGGAPTSVFADDEDAKATLDSFEAANPRLARVAREFRSARLDGDARGVRHYLIAGTCDPAIDPVLAMDMRMAWQGESRTLEWLLTDIKSPGDVGKLLFPDPFEFARMMKRMGDALQAARFRLDRDVIDTFFDLNPFLRDVGNFNWHVARTTSIGVLQQRNLPIYAESYVAVDTDGRGVDDRPPPYRWGDGTAPLLSATAGAQIRSDLPIDASAAERLLGPGTRARVVPLGKDPAGRFLEHSGMLDDQGVRDLIRTLYDDACRSAAP